MGPGAPRTGPDNLPENTPEIAPGIAPSPPPPPPARWSLTGRMTRRVMAAVGIGWMLALGVGLYVIDHEMRELLDEALEARTALALDYVQATGRADFALTEDEALRVIAPHGLLRAPPAQPAPWPALAQDGTARRDGWLVRRESSGGLVVELGQRLSLRREEWRESAQALLAMMLPLLALVLWVSRRTARAVLAPARDLAQQLQQRGAGDLAPLQPRGLPDELQPIAQAMNQHLARIGQLIAAERRLAADAAHELRTPLAAARAQAQLIVAGHGDPAQVAAALDRALARLGATSERLMQLARLDAGIALTRERVDLLRLIALLAEDFASRPLLIDDGDLEDLWLEADADALAILLRNLIGNGFDHGLGPVRLRLSRLGAAPQPGGGADATDADGTSPPPGRDSLAISIRNPIGPGASFRPGRFDKGPTSQGSGLGLAIAQGLARDLGFRLDLAMADGWAEARLTCPLAPSLAPPSRPGPLAG